MIIALILIGVYIFLLVTFGINKPVDAPCTHHQWIYGQDGHMICDKCKKKPLE